MAEPNKPPEGFIPPTPLDPDKKYVIVLNSVAMIDLKVEVRRHAPLGNLIVGLGPHPDWQLVLAEIAAYVNVIMDGSYDPQELDTIYYPDLTRRLENKRRIIQT